MILALSPMKSSLVPPLPSGLSVNAVIVLLVAILFLLNPRLRVPQVPLFILITLWLVLAFALGAVITNNSFNSATLLACLFLLLALQLRSIDQRVFGILLLSFAWLQAIAGMLIDLVRRSGAAGELNLANIYVGKYIGIFINPNQAGIVAAVTILLLTVFVRGRNVQRAFLWLLNSIFIITSQCRSALLGLIIGLGIYTLPPLCQNLFARRPTAKRRAMWNLALAFLGVVALGLVAALDADLRGKIEDAGFNSRLPMWCSVWRQLSHERPAIWLFGNGPAMTHVTTQGTLGRGLTVHSSYLQLICDYGLPVLVFSLLQTAVAIATVPREHRRAFLALCIPALIIGTVETQLFCDASFLWCAVIVAFHLCNGPDSSHPAPKCSQRTGPPCY
jgi:O-antigen ligase